MKKLVMLAVLLVVATVPLAGCASGKTVEAALDETFVVPIHADASLPSENLRLTFQEVSDDSRCPTSVECVSAGQAVYTIRFTRGKDAQSVTFVEPGGSGHQATATVLDYVVTAQLQPYPEGEGAIPPEEYAVILTVSRPPAVDAAPEDDLAAMYAAVIRRLLTQDSASGGLDLSSLYLVYVTGDATPLDLTAVPEPHILAPSLRSKIAAQLSNLSSNIQWVASMAGLPIEGTGATVAGGGVVVSLGNPHPGDGGTWQLYAGLYVSNLSGTGRIYILDKADGTWQVTGDTGALWIS